MYASVQFGLAGKRRVISSPFKGHLTGKVHSVTQQLTKVDQRSACIGDATAWQDRGAAT